MEFGILGPLEVREGSRSVPLRGTKQRALLAILLLHANEALSSTRLIDDLWGELAPPTALKALQVHVWRLRRSLADGERDGAGDLIATRPGGYEIRLRPGQLDLHRFEELRGEARRALRRRELERASDTLRQALALWRGAPLAEFAAEPFAGAEIARLEDLRVAALQERIDVDLELGRHGQLASELELLIQDHPLRERLREQLMLALYGFGRQAEALAVYRDIRRVLSDELGLEPGTGLQRLQQAILAHDPSLDPVPALQTRQQTPPDARPRAADAFIGRRRELGELLAALERALRGEGALLLLSGEPGIGKTRLASEFASRASERGALVLWGRCWEAGGAPAYWPWLQSLQHYVRERDARSLRAELGLGAADVARIVPDVADLLPDVAELLPDLSSSPPVEPDGTRFRLFDSVASFVRRASRGRALLFVLDDLHAADASSLLLLRFLALEVAHMRTLLVGTYRDTELGLDHPLMGTLAEVAREPATRQLTLSGLSRSDVGRFIQARAEVVASETLVDAVHDQTGGNPLFVREIVALVASGGKVGETSQGVRAVIARRLQDLSERCRRALSLASILGREFDLGALASLSGRSRGEIFESLEEAIARGVVDEAPGVPSRLRFSHALVRDAIYDDMGAVERMRLHRRAGAVLASLYAHDADPHLAELAHHYVQAVPVGDPDEAIDYAARAARRAARLLAYEEAARLYRLALQVLPLDEPAHEPVRCELLLELGEAEFRAGDSSRAKESLLQAAEIARRRQLDSSLARAALGYGGRLPGARAMGDEQVTELLQEALVALQPGDSIARVELMARLAGALRDRPSREPAASLSLEAVHMARRIGDPRTLAYALDGRYAAVWWPENPAQRLTIAGDLTTLAHEVGDNERAVHGHHYRLVALTELGEIPAARAELDKMERLAAELRQPAQLWLATADRAAFALLSGRLAEAEDLIARAHRIGRGAQQAEPELTYRTQLFLLRRHQGRTAEVRDVIERSVDEFPMRPLFRALLADVAVQDGDQTRARRTLADAAADNFEAFPPDNEWLVSLSVLGEVAAHVAAGEHAEALYGLLEPHAARHALNFAEISTGAVARTLGLLCAALGDRDDAERHFQHALELNASMIALPWLAHTEYDYGVVLLRWGRASDRTLGRELLARAAGTYTQAGMHLWARRAESLTGLDPLTRA
jgi:DNA-binding SARP family transcriptional activator